LKDHAVPLAELEQRIERLQEQMERQEIGGALVVQKADLFYFSGTAQNAHLFIPDRGEPVLLVKKSYPRARRESALRRVIELDGWSRLVETVKPRLATGRKIGLEMDILPASLYLRYQKMLAPAAIADISPAIRRVRAVKSPFELARLHAAAAVGEAVFRFAREILREGMTEVELSAQLEAFGRARGHQGFVRTRGFNQELFFGHVLSGESGAAASFFEGPTGGLGMNPSFPQGAGTKQIKRGEPVLIDYTTVIDGYLVDQTRIFCLGKLPPHLAEAHRTAIGINKTLASLGKAGADGRELYRRAAEMAQEAGLAPYFMGCEEKVGFIGHGVGLELDELPVIARNLECPLEEGMVVALEPKFIFPGEGAVGIEDTFVVRKHGLEQITRFDDDLQEL
jgi:Xaa-Pro aminopeptidase